MIIDSHSHPHFPELAGRTEQMLANMRKANVSAAVAVCTRCEEAPALLDLARRHKEFLPTLGVHPNTPADAACDPEHMAATLAASKEFVAVGEAGLDYFRDDCERKIQAKRFDAQIELAIQVDLPLIVHTRESTADALDMLEPAVKRGLRAVLHCFTGTHEQATRAWDAGIFVSYTGIVTFKKARELLAIAASAPLELSMIETDAPYLAPEPLRGKTNEPAHVKIVGEYIAAARGMDAGDYLAATADTCRSFYRL